MTPLAEGLNRRAFLGAGAFALALGRAYPGAAAPALRLAAIDWAMLETAMALGAMPVAVAELLAFRRSAGQQPAGNTVDLGLRGTPNLEVLSLVAPDLILSSSYYSFAEPQLQRIAPVFTRALYVPGQPPLPKVTALLADLSARLGDPQAGERAQATAQADLAALARRARHFADHPLAVFEIGDSRHIRIFGADSLFGGVLGALGLGNAWDHETRFAFAAPVPLARLAEFPQARLIITGDVPQQAERALARGALWNSLAPVRAGRLHRLPEMNPFGGLPSALRFARALVAALEAGA